MDLHFDHARKTGEHRSDAPTGFDNALISPDALLKTQAYYANTLNSYFADALLMGVPSG